MNERNPLPACLSHLTQLGAGPEPEEMVTVIVRAACVFERCFYPACECAVIPKVGKGAVAYLQEVGMVKGDPTP